MYVDVMLGCTEYSKMRTARIIRNLDKPALGPLRIEHIQGRRLDHPVGNRISGPGPNPLLEKFCEMWIRIFWI